MGLRYIIVLLMISNMLSAQQGKTIWVDTSYHLINEPYYFDSLKISIIPPAYFKPFHIDKKFGFIHKGAAATIDVEVIPNVLYTYVVQGMNKDELAKQHVTLKDHQEVLTNQGKKADWFLLGFTLGTGDKKMEFERMMLITGDAKRTILVIGNYPLIARNVLFQVMKESLLSIDF